MPKLIDPIDLHVGARLRTLRLRMKFSQEEFGEEVGVSYQQIQNYETGANRISASRLFRIARILAVSPGWFFEDLPPGVAAALPMLFARAKKAGGGRKNEVAAEGGERNG